MCTPTPVSILGVPAWAITSPSLRKRLLLSPEVSKDPRQPRPASQEVRKTWPLAPWVDVQSMLTAYGNDHRPLRRLVSPALRTPNRMRRL